MTFNSKSSKEQSNAFTNTHTHTHTQHTNAHNHLTALIEKQHFIDASKNMGPSVIVVGKNRKHRPSVIQR